MLSLWKTAVPASALAVGMCVAACSSSSPAGLTATSSCKQYLVASQAEQDAAVKKIAVAQNDSVVLTPLGRPNVDYYCGGNDAQTLGQAISRAGGKTGAQSGTTSASSSSSPSSSVPADVAAVRAKYPQEYATLQKLGAATCRRLVANPADEQAGYAALAAVTGLSASNVSTIAHLSNVDGPALAAAQALDLQTATELLTNPSSTAAATKAVAEIEAKLGLSNSEAAARLTALAKIPTSQLLLVQQDGPKIAAGSAQLTALARVPASDRALLDC